MGIVANVCSMSFMGPCHEWKAESKRIEESHGTQVEQDAREQRSRVVLFE